ncbi:hypothetical protein ACS4JF_21460, partial [Bacillus thuringiensis]|uniref:hypothetical protein n=1 Tax=Bacillus thuringiensis TaxID=1428 RepID=UPI00403C050E
IRDGFYFLSLTKKDTHQSVNIVLLSRIGLEYISQMRIEMVRKRENVFIFNVTSVEVSVN